MTESLLDLIWLGGRHFRVPPETRRVVGSECADEELSALQVFVLLLIGEDEVIYDPAAALARARRLVANCDGELVPQSGHVMYYTQHQIVDALVLKFLRDN